MYTILKAVMKILFNCGYEHIRERYASFCLSFSGKRSFFVVSHNYICLSIFYSFLEIHKQYMLIDKIREMLVI